MQQLQVYKQVKHNSKHSISAAASLQVSKFRIMEQLQVYKQVTNTTASIQYQQLPVYR
jgi:hypothetical protein